MDQPFRRTYSQITLDERRKIERWHAAKISVDVIAEKLGRHRSTIFRELKRNRFDDPEMLELAGYYGPIADTKSKDRRGNRRKLVRLPQLREAIIERILPWLVARASRRPSEAGRRTAWHDGLSRDNLPVCLFEGWPGDQAVASPAGTPGAPPAAACPASPWPPFQSAC